MARQEYYTTLEIAELASRLQVNSVPHTKRGVKDMIDREGWASSSLARMRNGRGGGQEYHLSLLPEFLVSAIIEDERKNQALADAERAMASEKTELEVLGTDNPTAKQRQVAEARLALVRMVDFVAIEKSLTTKGDAVAEVIERASTDRVVIKLARAANNKSGKQRTLTRASLYRWIKDYRENGIKALVPMNTRDTHSFPDWFPLFMGFYARPQAPTIIDALDQLKYETRINNPPSYDAVRRALKKLEKVKGTQARHRGREGVLTLKARHAYVLRDTTGLLPTSVYTADGKTFDAEVQHPIHGRPFRPEISTILDVATRRIVGWSVGLAENSLDVMNALRVACCTSGIPAIFYVDNGAGFKNDKLDNELTGFCARLGTTKMHSLPYSSQARGLIERLNGSLYTPLSKRMPSYVGVDMDRQARLANYKKTRKEVAEFGTSGSLPTWQEFIEAVSDAVIHYNDSQHDGLTLRHKGRKTEFTPNQVWQEAIQRGFEPVGVLPQEADDLFRPYERRRTNRAMVSIFTNSYFHMDLEPYHGLDVLVGYDVHDASKVWCREIDIIDGEERPGRLIAVAEFEGNKTRYVPLSAEQRAIEKRQAGRLRRLQGHMDEVNEEANPYGLLDQSSSKPMQIIPNSTALRQPAVEASTGEISSPPVLASNSNSSGKPAPANPDEVAAPDASLLEGAATPRIKKDNNGRPFFGEPAEHAAWCCKNSEEINENDRSLLRAMLNNKSDREYLRINEVDLSALEKLIRSAA